MAFNMYTVQGLLPRDNGPIKAMAHQPENSATATKEAAKKEEAELSDWDEDSDDNKDMKDN